MGDRLGPYRAKRDFGATPEPAPAEAVRRRTAGATSSRSTTRARCTGTCGSSTRARSPPGRSRRASRPIPSATTSPCARRTTRSSTSSSTATSRRATTAPGTMRIWDRGTYELHKFREDEVMVTFHGERLEGRYVLFRTGGKNWMIHRMDPPQDADREPMPERIEPMLARTGALPPDDGRWAYEVKWDGVRAIGYAEGGRLQAGQPQRQRHHAALPRAARARPRARLARGGARRRGGGVRARRQAELPGAPEPHARRLRERAAAARGRAPRRLRDLRPALPRRPLADGGALRRAARAAARARAQRAELADAGAPGRRRRGAARGHARPGPGGHHRQAARLPVHARAAAPRAGSRSRTSAARRS